MRRWEENMAPGRHGGVSSHTNTVCKEDINNIPELVLTSKKHANIIFQLIQALHAEQECVVLPAISACRRLFPVLLDKHDMAVCVLPPEHELLSVTRSAQDKYGLFLRYRYRDCIQQLLELMGQWSFMVRESALCALMEFVSAEARHPLQPVDSDTHFNFPRELLRDIVGALLSEVEDTALLISRFHQFLQMDDVRFYVMGAIREHVARVMDHKYGVVQPIFQTNVFTLLCSINVPHEESELKHFLFPSAVDCAEWKPARLKEHRRSFERMWLGFLKHQLPAGLYKKILVILHDSILPHMNQPTLMMDFLTAAYSIGGAISLLALNGLFILIHQHNLEYPDFYKKLYSLLEPSVFHVKYRARFFHLTNLFLSSTHLPVYLVAAFVKRLSRLALTAPPDVLLMVLPFICNLIRRHPSCRVLLHRPHAQQELLEDPYVLEESDPALCHAMESSLWELQSLQKHYHPDVANAASVINQPLSAQEVELDQLLDMSSYQLFQQELQKSQKDESCVPLEFECVTKLLQDSRPLATHFSLN